MIKQYKQNLLNLYNKHKNQHYVQEGLCWYSSARTYFGQLADKYKLPHNKVYAVVAALSPFQRWETQLTKTEPFIAAELRKKGMGRFPGFRSNVRTARYLLHSKEEPKLTGRKVSAFYKNLSGDSTEVTLDRHAISAALGVKQKENYRIDNNTFSAIRRAYVECAQRVNLGLSTFQAIIWTIWKRNARSA